MKSAQEHAARNGLVLVAEGPCPMCGAPTGTGYDGCLADSLRLGELLDFSDPAHQLTRFLSVDAMALQHSEVHGRWNNHLHLARLRLVLVDGIVWRYPFTPLLSAAMDSYRHRRPRPVPLAPPPPGRRGALTAHDLADITDAHAATVFTRQWAASVYAAYRADVATILPLTADFVARLNRDR
jgi:Family of unknown function (DUF5946)